MARGVIKAPFFEIGPKSYLYGDDVLELALEGQASMGPLPVSFG